MFSGFRIQEARERLPIVDSGIDPEHDNDIQETLILAHTSKPLVDDQIRSQKLDRMSNKKMSASTIHGEMIQNPSLQFNTRQRWKPERERPTRPGAAALLRPPQHVPPAGVRQEPAIPPRISFKMDEDDVEQMQADTGFHPSWKLNATKPSRKDWVAPE